MHHAVFNVANKNKNKQKIYNREIRLQYQQQCKDHYTLVLHEKPKNNILITTNRMPSHTKNCLELNLIM